MSPFDFLVLVCKWTFAIDMVVIAALLLHGEAWFGKAVNRLLLATVCLGSGMAWSMGTLAFFYLKGVPH